MSYLGVISAGLLGAAIALGMGCGDDSAAPVPQQQPFTPAPLQMRRLLAQQYRGTIKQLFGPAAAAVAAPPNDASLNGFRSIAASQQALTEGLVSSYESSARAVATVAVADWAHIDALAGCHPKPVADGSCMRRLVERLGRRMFRRPLTPDEVADYQALGVLATNRSRNYYTGVRFVIIAMLQSPNFLFQVEVGREATDAVGGEGQLSGTRTLTRYELASRLSFLLLDRGPDEALIAATEAGQLDTPAGVRAIAQQMLTSADASKAVRSFFREYLALDKLGTLAKDPVLFPQFNASLVAAMEDETLKLVEDVVFVRDAPVHELFTARYTFVNNALATLYHVKPPSGAGWRRAELPPEQGRIGILGHASILAQQAHPTATSATRRGLFIMERFLCTSMPPPPPNVVPELPPSSLAPTLRERLAVHLSDPGCRACHHQSDNLGLALETFDAIGAYRKEENGAPIDVSGNTAPLGAFDGLAGMAPRLASSEEVMRCIVKQVYRNASGRVESQRDTAALNNLHARFRDGGYRFKQLLIELVSSPAFRTIAFEAASSETQP
ncbi:MAG TPA: DUF1592 domain-containing protein [Sorangium sp.]|nr:DUF1592 domain-containing protein [Sorangium sp.]